MKFAARILLLAAALVVVRPALACCSPADFSPQAEAAAAELPGCHDSADDPRADSVWVDSQPCPCADSAPPPVIDENRGAQTNERSFKFSALAVGYPSASVLPESLRAAGPPPAATRAAQTPVRLKQRLLI